MYKLYLALRYLRKRRITYFAVLSVALCTAMVLGVHAVMTGFLQTVKESSRQLLGDVILEIGSMSTFPLYDEFIAELHTAFEDKLVAATPVVLNAGWVTLLAGPSDHRTFPVIVNGIRLEEYVRVNRLGDGLFYHALFPGTTTLEPQRRPTVRRDDEGRLRLPEDLEAALARADPERARRLLDARPQGTWPGPGLFKASEAAYGSGDGYTGQAYPGVILGIGLVAERRAGGEFERGVPRGTLVRLTVLPHSRSGPADATVGATEAFRYVDDARSRIHEIDSSSVYCGFDVLQRLLELDGRSGSAHDRPRAAQIQVRMAAGVDLGGVRDTIETLWSDFVARHSESLSVDDLQDMQWMQVRTWWQRNAGFITAIEKQRVLVLILLGVISLVAIVLVGCTFYMIAQERTVEIGIIKSMGAGGRGIAGIFLTYAAAVGVVGSIIGVIAGWLFVHYINDIQELLANLHPRLRMWNPEVYSFEQIPNMVRVADVAVIIGVGILAAVIGSTAAARKAARVWPTKALHYR